MNSVSVVVLLVGTVIGVTEAALISRACWEFLCRAYPDRRTAKQVAALIAGMAVPLLFGAVILVATLGVGAPGIDTATGLSAVLARVGVLFLLVAAVHALVLVVLSRDRKQEHEIAATEEQIAASHHPDGG
ncbi:MAG TPA: hypothetical protein VFE65_23800 [Pseudonocardia sp.]|nr:hypothetical protein [Pseudonocardia sp.]